MLLLLMRSEVGKPWHYRRRRVGAVAGADGGGGGRSGSSCRRSCLLQRLLPQHAMIGRCDILLLLLLPYQLRLAGGPCDDAKEQPGVGDELPEREAGQRTRRATEQAPEHQRRLLIVKACAGTRHGTGHDGAENRAEEFGRYPANGFLRLVLTLRLGGRLYRSAGIAVWFPDERRRRG